MTHYCFFNTFPRLLNYAYERLADAALHRIHSAFEEQPCAVFISLGDARAPMRELAIDDRVATNQHHCVLLLDSRDGDELARVKKSFDEIMKLPSDDGRRENALSAFDSETRRKCKGFYLFFDTRAVPFDRTVIDCTVTYRRGDGDDVSDMVFMAHDVPVARFAESAPQRVDGANATLYIHASLFRQQTDDARFLFVCFHSIAIEQRPSTSCRA